MNIVESRLANLRSKETRLVAESAALIADGLRTASDRSQNESILQELRDTREDIRMIEQTVNNLPKTAPVAAPVATAPAIRTSKRASTERREQRDRITKAFRSVLRHGFHPNFHPEQRDLNTSTSTDGPELVPQGFDTVWTEAIKNVAPIATLVKSKTSNDGRPMKTVVNDTTALNLSYVPETNSSSSAAQTPSVKSEIVGMDSQLGRVNVSWNELDDSWNLESWLSDTAAIVVGRGLEFSILTGTDPGTTTALPNSYTGGLLAATSAGVTQTSGELAAGPTYTQLSSLAASVDHAYAFAPNSGYLGSQSVHDFLTAQVDTTGRPLYKRDPNTGLLQVAGHPFYVASNAAMPAYNTASSKIVLFGDFSRAFAVNKTDVRFKVQNETLANVLESIVLFYVRMGSTQLLTNAVKALVTAAS